MYPKSRVRNLAGAISLVVGLVVLAAAQNGQPAYDLSNIRIKNFGRIDDGYYRGAQPGKADYAQLAALGIKCVVDVHRRGPSEEQRLVEAAGMKFFRIPLDEDDVPTSAQVEQFLSIVDDSANKPVFVHCAGGRHRTGALTAIYRMNHDKWTADQAFAEMKQYEFLKEGNHSALKDFVYNFQNHQARSNVAAASN